jgi:RHS repeat-associated protein
VEYIYLEEELLAMVRPNGAIYYFHNDHLGTPRVLTNETGTPAWKASYSPFGLAQILLHTVENPFRFQGQYYDAETGYHYNYHRYYDPKTGRYLTPDPIGLAGGINPYVYVQNDPVNWIDPYGLFGDGRRRSGNTTGPFGHSDFTGYYDLFDYTEEDRGWTSPYLPWSTPVHFRDRFSVELDLRLDLRSCDKSKFRSHMHQGQDSFNHHDNGFRWWMFHDLEPNHWGPGHTFGGHGPDHDKAAWDKAEAWTKTWVNRWRNECEGKCNGR